MKSVLIFSILAFSFLARAEMVNELQLSKSAVNNEVLAGTVVEVENGYGVHKAIPMTAEVAEQFSKLNHPTLCKVSAYQQYADFASPIYIYAILSCAK